MDDRDIREAIGGLFLANKELEKITLGLCELILNDRIEDARKMVNSIYKPPKKGEAENEK